MCIASSMASLHSIGEDDPNEVQYDFLGSSTGIFPNVLSMTIKMRCKMTFWPFDALGTGISVT